MHRDHARQGVDDQVYTRNVQDKVWMTSCAWGVCRARCGCAGVPVVGARLGVGRPHLGRACVALQPLELPLAAAQEAAQHRALVLPTLPPQQLHPPAQLLHIQQHILQGHCRDTGRVRGCMGLGQRGGAVGTG